MPILMDFLAAVKQVNIISMNSVFESIDSLAFSSDVMELQMEIIRTRENKRVSGTSTMEGNYSLLA